MAVTVTNYDTVNGKIRTKWTGERPGSQAVFHDPLGSVVGIYEDGWLKADRVYDASGETRAEWNDVGTFGWVGGYGYRETRREWVSHYVRARHYSYMTGGWTSVDPLWPSEMAYGYVEGRVMSGIDPSGKQLFGAVIEICRHSPCASYPGGACAYAKSLGDDGGDYGGVICCEGKKIPCAWNYPPNTFPGIVKCTRVHEYDHLDDVDCESTGYSRPPFKPGKDPTHEECNAISIHVSCLIKERTVECSKYSGDKREKCLKDYRYHLCLRCSRLKSLGCSSSKIPRNCNYCP